MWSAMNNKLIGLIDKLAETHSLSKDECKYLIENRTDKDIQYAAVKAVKARQDIYGKAVYLRGLIEISNICRNDCLYCGIRRSNSDCDRYRLSAKQISDCCDEGYNLGFRTFVLQGGEDGYFTDEVICKIIREIKQKHPDCAVTLSLGERS